MAHLSHRPHLVAERSGEWTRCRCAVRLQVMWSPDGNFLYSGARQDPRILCWDVRNSGQVLYAMHRSSGTTNQRLDFDIEPCGRHLATGACSPQPRCR